MITLPGYRVIGTRKKKLIDIADKHLVELHEKGVNTHVLLKVLGIHDLDFQKVTTKKWTGIIGRIVEFRRMNQL